MILEIDGKTYTKLSLDELSMTHLAMLQRELPKLDDLTTCRSLADVQRARDELSVLTDDERVGHPEIFFMAILGVWMAKANAGEMVGVRQAALDVVDWASVREIPEPQDHAPKAKAPKKGPSPKGSARGASSQHAKASREQSPTTSEKSSTESSST